MHTIDRATLAMSDHSPTLGIPVMRLETRASQMAKEAYVPADEPRTLRVITEADLAELWTEIADLRADVRALSVEVQRRSLEGVMARMWAWVKGWFR